MRIAIASDHAAVALKADLREYLIGLGHEVADLGPETADRVDYPDFGYKLAEVVADGTAEYGVALCGSGIGIGRCPCGCGCTWPCGGICIWPCDCIGISCIASCWR